MILTGTMVQCIKMATAGHSLLVSCSLAEQEDGS